MQMSRFEGLWYVIYWLTPGHTLLQKGFHPNVLWPPGKEITHLLDLFGSPGLEAFFIPLLMLRLSKPGMDLGALGML